MYSTHYLGRQPIVDARENLVGYELLFRSSPVNAAHVVDDFAATATVIRHAFVDLGVAEVLGDRLGYINVDEQLLMSDLVNVLPHDTVVLEILETVRATPALLVRLAELRQRGFRMAMDDLVSLTSDKRALLDYVDIVKIDLSQVELGALPALLQALEGFRGSLLAEKVDNPEQFETCREFGFKLFQGYFFAHPTVIHSRQVRPKVSVLLRLLGLILSDAETDALEEAFKSAPDIALMLLRLTSTAVMADKSAVTSIRQAILLLGRDKIKRWTLLLMFATATPQGDKVRHNPLLELAAMRGRIMERLAQSLRPEAPQLAEQAFMVGILSLVDALMLRPKTELIPQLPVDQIIKDAVLDGRHILGEWLKVTVSLEDENTVQPAGYDAELLTRIETESLDWVKRMWA
ncbi:diguanylate phosphodiesterase [Pseudogulbenkiania sp. NH8B]|uniref:EAL and HDOD domain-containing protein n=1 Tax=Pseudogulbenkiania sp. (strain NH8B) TaxID=748280 RepID=UPI000227A43D|nr:EAL domain-containing protein [Pseudogulbenkiania sp. NH8B]BAK78744.1 diguanylate phosphodiesterase [Pseudogulbenkiania sp. NH8B]